MSDMSKAAAYSVHSQLEWHKRFAVAKPSIDASLDYCFTLESIEIGSGTPTPHETASAGLSQADFGYTAVARVTSVVSRRRPRRDGR
jgi:hypothetical protein